MAGGGKQRRFLIAILVAVALTVGGIVIFAVSTTSRPEPDFPVEHDVDLEMGLGASRSPAQAAAENYSGRRDAGGLLG